MCFYFFIFLLKFLACFYCFGPLTYDLALTLAIQGLIGNKFEIIIGSSGFVTDLGRIIVILLIKNDGGDGDDSTGAKNESSKEWVGPSSCCEGRHRGIKLIGRWIELEEHA